MAIKDQESAKAWLEGASRTREEIVAFAARAAMRALPGLGRDGGAALGGLALPVLRAMLTSGVASQMPTPEVRKAASAAFSATDADARKIEDSALKDVFATPLWPDGGVPDFFAAAFLQLRMFWNAAPETWAFWWRWYDGMLNGAPLPWELQESVALIPDKEWEKGPERVAEVIAKIEARLEVDRTASQVVQFLEAPRQVNSQTLNPMIGHNNPPRDGELPISVPELERLLVLVQALQVQIQGTSPDPRTVQTTADQIEATHKTIGIWLAQKLNLSADEFFKEFGKWGGGLAAAGLAGAAFWFLGLIEKLGPLLAALRNWLAIMAG